MSEILSLKSLLNPNKGATVDYPGIAGFTLQLSFLSREALVALRKKATTSSWRPGKGTVESINEELFLQLYTKAAIKGWKGLTMEKLATLASIDIPEGSEEVELAYSEENALMLMKNSAAFDGFVSETANDLSNFQKNSGSK